MQERVSASSIVFKEVIHEDDAIKFKDLYQSIDVSTIDPKYSFPLRQEFSIDFDSFLETVLNNLSKKTINFSFIEKEPVDENDLYDIGLLIHFSDSEEDCFNEATDTVYRIDGSELIMEPNTSQYPNLRKKFRDSLGACIAQQTKKKVAEVVIFKMTDVVNYLLVNVYGLPRVPDIEALTIDLEMLQYTNEGTTGNHTSYSLYKNRISIGARLSFSYLQDGTSITGKLPLYNIGTLHP